MVNHTQVQKNKGEEPCFIDLGGAFAPVVLGRKMSEFLTNVHGWHIVENFY